MAEDFVNRGYFSSGAVPLPGIPENSTPVANAATSARNAAQVSDKVVQDILKSVIPGIDGAVQNGPHVMLPNPIHPKQLSMTPPGTGHGPETTRAGHIRNNITDIVHGAGNIVKTVINNKREKEDQALTADLALIQAASSNPEDPHNKAILDALASDPKRMKRIQKALGYNPFSGEAPSPEAVTLAKFKKQQQAKEMQQKIAGQMGPEAAQMQTPNPNDPNVMGRPMVGGKNNAPPISPGTVMPGNTGAGAGQPGFAMQNLMNRMPNVPHLSPLVQMQGELIKLGIMPKADTSLRAMTDLIKEIMTDDAKYAEIKGKLDNTNAHMAGVLQAIHDKYKLIGQNQTSLEGIKQAGANTRADERNKTAIKVQELKNQSSYERYKAKFGDEKARNLDRLIKNIDADIKNLDVQIAGAKDDKSKQALREEQAAKKAQKDALEGLMNFRDVGGQDTQTSPTDELRENKNVTPEEMDEGDGIWGNTEP